MVVKVVLKNLSLGMPTLITHASALKYPFCENPEEKRKMLDLGQYTASAGKSGGTAGESGGKTVLASIVINTASAGVSGGQKSVGLNCHHHGVNGEVS